MVCGMQELPSYLGYNKGLYGGTSDEHRGLYGKLIDCYLNRDIEECAQLAHQIAELPEKRQNIHYNKEETHTEERIDDD